MDYPNTNASLRLIEEPTNKKKNKKKKDQKNIECLDFKVINEENPNFKATNQENPDFKDTKKENLDLKAINQKNNKQKADFNKTSNDFTEPQKKINNYQREPCCNCRLCCEKFVNVSLILLYIIFILNPIAQFVLNIINKEGYFSFFYFCDIIGTIYIICNFLGGDYRDNLETIKIIIITTLLFIFFCALDFLINAFPGTSNENIHKVIIYLKISEFADYFLYFLVNHFYLILKYN